MKTEKLTKQQIIDWATSRSWKLDKWGHLQKTIDNRQYRFKLSSTAVRYEVKSEAGWLRLRSGYFKDLSVNPEGKLTGLRL